MPPRISLMENIDKKFLFVEKSILSGLLCVKKIMGIRSGRNFIDYELQGSIIFNLDAVWNTGSTQEPDEPKKGLSLNSHI